MSRGNASARSDIWPDTSRFAGIPNKTTTQPTHFRHIAKPGSGGGAPVVPTSVRRGVMTWLTSASCTSTTPLLLKRGERLWLWLWWGQWQWQCAKCVRSKGWL